MEYYEVRERHTQVFFLEISSVFRKKNRDLDPPIELNYSACGMKTLSSFTSLYIIQNEIQHGRSHVMTLTCPGSWKPDSSSL